MDRVAVVEEIERIREKTNEADVEHTFNMDETGIFYRFFPRATYVTGQEIYAGLTIGLRGVPGP